MKKQEQEANGDLEKTLAAQSEKIIRFVMDLGPILGSIWDPISMQNRIEIWLENRDPKNRPKRASARESTLIDGTTSRAPGPLGGRGETTNQPKRAAIIRSNKPSAKGPANLWVNCYKEIKKSIPRRDSEVKKFHRIHDQHETIISKTSRKRAMQLPLETKPSTKSRYLQTVRKTLKIESRWNHAHRVDLVESFRTVVLKPPETQIWVHLGLF